MRALIPLMKIKEVVRDFRALGGEVLQISGGEPLLHPDLFEAIRFAKGLGLEVRLYTSGLLGLRAREIRPLDADFIASLKDSGLDRIILNLQGARAETHETITKTPRSFGICLSSIVACKSISLWVGIHFVPMKLNYEEVEQVVDLAERLSVDEVGILRFVPQGRGEFYRGRLEMSAEEMRILGKRILALKARCKKLRIRTGSPMNFLREMDQGYQPVQCTAGRSTCNITADGNIVPCPAFKKVAGFAAGNILEQTLAQVWGASPLLRELRQPPERELLGECFAQKVIARRTAEAGEPEPSPEANLRILWIRSG
jgi:radical SAM protein with 4Fe4S-binding SPASM domain